MGKVPFFDVLHVSFDFFGSKVRSKAFSAKISRFSAKELFGLIFSPFSSIIEAGPGFIIIRAGTVSRAASSRGLQSTDFNTALLSHSGDLITSFFLTPDMSGVNCVPFGSTVELDEIFSKSINSVFSWPEPFFSVS